MAFIDDELEKEIETESRKVVDDSYKINASYAEEAGMEVTVDRQYDGVGLHDGEDICEWCLNLDGHWSYKDAVSNGVFSRHAGCGCDIVYNCEKGSRRQTNWRNNEWTGISNRSVINDRRQYGLSRKIYTGERLLIEAENPFKNPNTPLTINTYDQSKHIVGGVKYNEYIRTHKHQPSYLIISEKEAQGLIEKFHGTGILKIDRKGNIIPNEIIVDNDIPIGYAVNNKNGEKVLTTGFKIHYSKEGTHIVPAYENQKQYWKERRERDGYDWLLRQKG